jgi:hypothetical protein
LNLSSPQFAPLGPLYQDFKEFVIHKPQYRNQGEANKVFREGFSEARRIYHNFVDILPEFLTSPNIKYNKGSQQSQMMTMINQRFANFLNPQFNRFKRA